MRVSPCLAAVLPALTLVAFLAPAVPLGAQDDSSDLSDAFDIGAELGIKRMWIQFITSIQQRDNIYEITLQGHTNYPDGTTFDVLLERRNQPTNAIAVVVVQQGGFEGKLFIYDRLFPGYYTVRVNFSPWRQEGPDADELAGYAEDSALCPLRFPSTGTKEAMQGVVEEHLNYYEGVMNNLEKLFGQMDDLYPKLIASRDLEQSTEEWHKKMGHLPEGLAAGRDRCDNLVAGYAIAAFPLLHEAVRHGFGVLQSAYERLSFGLVVKITEEMTRKGIDKQWFLKKARESVSDYLKGVRTQIMLEHESQLRELLLDLIGSLIQIFQDAGQTFSVALPQNHEAIREQWLKLSAKWKETIKQTGKEMKVIRRSPLEEEYKSLVRALLEAPDMLLKLVRQYDRVILDEKPYDEVERKILELQTEVHARLIPSIDILGFNRELFWDQITRPGQARALKQARDWARKTGMGFTAESVERGLLREDGEELDAIDRYVRRAIEELSLGDPRARMRAAQKLIALGERSVPFLKETIRRAREGGEDPTAATVPELTCVGCAVCLAHLGDEFGAPELIGHLEHHPDYKVRKMIPPALGMLREHKYIRPVAKALRSDDNPVVRTASAMALGYLFFEDSVEPILDALEDPVKEVRAYAKVSLETLTGETVAFSFMSEENFRVRQVAEIRRWWSNNKARLILQINQRRGKEEAPPAPAEERPDEEQ